jgi:S1-C subfamily serine protease
MRRRRAARTVADINLEPSHSPMTPQAPAEHDPSTSPRLADAVESLAASVVGLGLRRGSASGVVWQPGVVLTSASALWRAREVQLVLPGGEPVQAQLRGIDPGTDIAALSFEGAAVPPARRAEAAAPRAGDFVFAVGREPSGLVQASFGHVGAAAGEWRSWRGGRIERLIRLDGGLYPGLAGAAVGNAQGECIGLASPAFSRLHGVVLPVATLDRVLAALLAHGRVPQGYLGIAAQPARATLDGAATDGLLVASVADDGPAAKAGLLVGDVIVSAGGQPVASIEALRERLGGDTVGGTLALRVARGGQALTLTLDVAERPRSRCG